MRLMSISIIVAMVFLLVLIIGGIALQIFLSKKQNKWFGLILPLICLTFSIVSVLGNVAFSTVQNTSSVVEITDSSGKVIGTEEMGSNQVAEKTTDYGSVVASTIVVFLILNIPTIILLAIYFACREKIKVHSAIEKMKIQDL
jgi:hypothetical protein